jgi:hypothetical protein
MFWSFIIRSSWEVRVSCVEVTLIISALSISTSEAFISERTNMRSTQPSRRRENNLFQRRLLIMISKIKASLVEMESAEIIKVTSTQLTLTSQLDLMIKDQKICRNELETSKLVKQYA